MINGVVLIIVSNSVHFRSRSFTRYTMFVLLNFFSCEYRQTAAGRLTQRLILDNI